MKKISLKSQRRMMDDASRGKWYNLVELKRVPEFAAWLTDEAHEWQGQSPDEGEILRLHRHGTTLVVWYDGRRTICGRHVMALWHTFYVSTIMYLARKYLIQYLRDPIQYPIGLDWYLILMVRK